jgi:hypothetical protein
MDLVFNGSRSNLFILGPKFSKYYQRKHWWLWTDGYSESGLLVGGLQLSFSWLSAKKNRSHMPVWHCYIYHYNSSNYNSYNYNHHHINNDNFLPWGLGRVQWPLLFMGFWGECGLGLGRVYLYVQRGLSGLCPFWGRARVCAQPCGWPSVLAWGNMPWFTGTY